MTTIYTTLALLKKQLNLTDTDRDDLLNHAIESASRSIDDHCGRVFYLDAEASARSFRLARGSTYGALLLVDDIGSTDDLAVASGNGSTWTDLDATGYSTDPDNALTRGRPITGLHRAAGSWWSSTHVRVTARWGWPAVPGPVAQAALLQASRLFGRRNSPQGFIGSAEFGVGRVSRIDPDVHALLAAYVLPGFA